MGGLVNCFFVQTSFTGDVSVLVSLVKPTSMKRIVCVRRLLLSFCCTGMGATMTR